ncbi:uncharacterized protein Bfra_008593 [Botrytis fragariae]|uniref:Uncharacterized protein n=1 Tax=Botrytis fragariae TaxID=1964551 RepID=A0A8H6AT50_9HELO|nr:uncharacterized protein Bfra_008593 [Botrytis fragariae]KAF5873311.1 hypothetical protein Bfra_008593 [Botrytis fragariae]
MKVVSTGAMKLRKVFTTQQLKDIFGSYMVGSKKAHIFGIAIVEINAAKAAKEKEESENQYEEFGERNDV